MINPLRQESEITVSLTVEKKRYVEQTRLPAPETGLPMKTGGDPFSFLRIEDRDFLVMYLANEYAQTAALVLSHLEPGLAAAVLEGFGDSEQPEIIRRIAAIQRTSPEVNQEVASILEARVTGLGPGEFTSTGGVETVVNILNVASRSFEKHVVETLEKSESDLAEDIILLDDRVISLVLARADRNDLLKALKVADKPLSERILGCMPEEKVKPFNRDFQSLGPVRLRDVEDAQQRIVEVIRRLEEAGEIIVAPPGELVD